MTKTSIHQDFCTVLFIEIPICLSSGFHILQRIDGCELDENTGEVAGVLQYGHNGEDFLKFDLKTLKWIAQKPEAESIQQKWNADVAKNNYYKSSLTGICPQWLKKYLDAGKSSLQRRGRFT